MLAPRAPLVGVYRPRQPVQPVFTHRVLQPPELHSEQHQCTIKLFAPNTFPSVQCFATFSRLSAVSRSTRTRSTTSDTGVLAASPSSDTSTLKKPSSVVLRILSITGSPCPLP